jgi:long-chain fatty acid transport protein
VPSFFAVYKLTDDMALGFGFYFPYGGGKIDFENAYDYDSRAASAYPNVNENLFDITKDFRAYTFTLSGAYKISDILSVGAGLSLYYVTLGIQTENKLVNVPTSGPLAGYGIYGKTDQFISGMGVSGNFGIMLKPVQGLSLGLSTRLPFSVKLEGDFKIKDSYALDGSGNVIPGSSGAADSTNDSYKKISAPWSIGFGVGYQVTAKWLVSMDVEYQMWDQADEIKSKNTESSSEETNSYGWENTLRFGLGTEYMLTPALALLGGFKIAPSAPQDGYYGLDNVDLTAYALFLGLGYDITESIKVEGGFSYVYYPDKTQDSLEPSDTDPATPAPLVGEMEKNIMGGGIQVKYLF